MWWNLKSRGLSNTLLSKLSRPAGPLTSYFLATNACATIKTAKSLSFIVGTWFRRFWPRAFLFTRWDKDIGPFLNRAFFRPSQIRQVHATSTRTFHFITCTTDRTCLVRTLGFWHETKIWWRMDQNAPHNARESWWGSSRILLHNFRDSANSQSKK